MAWLVPLEESEKAWVEKHGWIDACAPLTVKLDTFTSVLLTFLHFCITHRADVCVCVCVCVCVMHGYLCVVAHH